MTDRTYIAIDLKSFYASVECVERGLDPMTTNRGGGQKPYGENDLPCRFSFPESIWYPRQTEIVRSSAEGQGGQRCQKEKCAGA